MDSHGLATLTPPQNATSQQYVLLWFCRFSKYYYYLHFIASMNTQTSTASPSNKMLRFLKFNLSPWLEMTYTFLWNTVYAKGNQGTNIRIRMGA
jgi:hypothetical protein